MEEKPKSVQEKVISASEISGCPSQFLNELEDPTQPLRLRGFSNRSNAFLAMDTPVHMTIEGSLGDYAFSHNRQCHAVVEGNVGSGCGDGMISGSVRIRGNAGLATGIGLSGGTVAVYGSTGPYCGAAMRGGEIFVRGDAGAGAGARSLWGTIVIGGNAGEGLGDLMRGATIFIRGTCTSLGRGVREAELREREKLRLGLLLINAGIRGEVSDFRRIVSEVTFQRETTRRASEVNPSWR